MLGMYMYIVYYDACIVYEKKVIRQQEYSPLIMTSLDHSISKVAVYNSTLANLTQLLAFFFFFFATKDFRVVIFRWSSLSQLLLSLSSFSFLLVVMVAVSLCSDLGDIDGSSVSLLLLGRPSENPPSIPTITLPKSYRCNYRRPNLKVVCQWIQ